MLVLLKLVLFVVFVFSAVAAFHKWLDFIEQRRVVVTWGRIFIWLWVLATAAWLGPMVLLGLLHGDFFRASGYAARGGNLRHSAVALGAPPRHRRRPHPPQSARRRRWPEARQPGRRIAARLTLRPLR